MHWRKTPRDPRQVWLALLVVVLLHALFALAIWHAMRPSLLARTTYARHETAMQIRFIDSVPAPPQAEPPPPPVLPSRPAVATRAPPPPKVREAPAKNSLTVVPPPAAPAPHLYDQNGQPLLPSAASTPAPAAPDYVQRLPQGDTQVMNHDNPIKYQATRFDHDWVKGNAVDQALQKIVDKTTVKKTVRLPGGVRVHCAVFLLFGGCGGEPPPPPSKKDGDERLSMAPARSLAPDPHAPAPPSVEACIAMYRAGKPLAWGCPVDTPNRAVDEETRERAAGHPH